MDARSYAQFLKKDIIEKAKEFENTLLSASYENINQAKRISGIRDGLIGIANSLDENVEKFYKEGLVK